MQKLEGIHYVKNGWTKTGKPRKRKPTTADLLRLREVCSSTQAESDQIREAAGLDPLPENFYRAALAAEIEKRNA